MKALHILPFLHFLHLSVLAFSDSQPPTPNPFTTNPLPPNMLPLSHPNYIFSGFGSSFLMNLETGSSYQIIADLEKSCSLPGTPPPFYPRLIINSGVEAYYYCPSHSLIYKLNPSSNFSLTGKQFLLPQGPAFHEAKLTIFQNNLFLLGLINAPNLRNNTCNNFTSSHLIQINLQTSMVVRGAEIEGVHEEPIVHVEFLSDGRVIAVGEKVYQSPVKLNTYYIGRREDTLFSKVLDFYLAVNYDFIPQVKISQDQTLIFYTNENTLLSYNLLTFKITRYQNVTLANNEYKEGDEVKLTWGKIPFAISANQENIYVYNQGNFTTLRANGMAKVKSHAVPFEMKNFQHGQFNFFEEGKKDKSFFQSDNFMISFELDVPGMQKGFDGFKSLLKRRFFKGGLNQRDEILRQ